MKPIHRFASAVAVSVCLLGSAFAGDPPTKEDAVAMVKRAIAHYQKFGAEKTIAAINNKAPEFFQGELYVAANDPINGIALAHPLAPKMVGKYMMDLKDSDGTPFAKELWDVAKSGKPGWVDYRWPNPVTKEIQDKTAYVEAAPDGKIYFNSGVYKKK